MKAVWLYLGSSIGRKQILGAAGAGLALFLAGHAAGNFTLLNPDTAAAQAAYNAYARLLTSLKPFLYAVEAGLLALLGAHAGVATWLKLTNRKARGAQRYAVARRIGPCTPASYTMYLSGLAILVFLAQHLVFIKYGAEYLYRDASGAVMRDMWLTMALTLSNPWWSFFYVCATGLMGCHLIHALPSLVRTFGLVHRQWVRVLEVCACAAGAALALAFAVTAAGSCVLLNRDSAQRVINKALADQPALAQEVRR